MFHFKIEVTARDLILGWLCGQIREKKKCLHKHWNIFFKWIPIRKKHLDSRLPFPSRLFSKKRQLRHQEKRATLEGSGPRLGEKKCFLNVLSVLINTSKNEREKKLSPGVKNKHQIIQWKHIPKYQLIWYQSHFFSFCSFILISYYNYCYCS